MSIDFGTVLVANRGEIARRVFTSCRRLGLGTVAVFSDPDERSPHVSEADHAVRLPGSSAADTYLNLDRIIAAARVAGADAVHPGYGFLSERADFAAAVLAAGLVWIGPPPPVIASMGSKVRAKQLMAAAGVPVLAELDPGQLTAAQLPVLVKASAGGGGRGMRLVEQLDQLQAALEAARTEAGRSFGDEQVFCERYLPAGHHLEVQLLADSHGTIWPVGERECSVQRRHQKVIEESPAPLAERIGGLRERLFDAAVAAARAIDYRGAGTVEFIADEAGNAYFLEMNTRLQVEHPVTEAVSGLDLVEWQLRIAAGEPLPATPPPARGHAIEVRLYAEDPAAGWQPQTGPLHGFEFPGVDACFRPGALRLDAGVAEGSEISPHYDAMLAKLICHDADRATATRRLAAALRRARLHGPSTNRDQLIRVLTDPDFAAGNTTTAMLERAELRGPLLGPELERVAAAAAALTAAAAEREQATVLRGLPSGWRNVCSGWQLRSLTGPAGRHDIRYRCGRSGLDIQGMPDVRVVSVTPAELVLEQAGMHHRLTVTRIGDQAYVDSAAGSVRFSSVPRFADPSASVRAGSLLAPLPGSVLRLAVAAGQPVTQGEPLLWIEAMKMEHPVTAEADGVVAELAVAAGDQVSVGDLLVVLAPVQQPEQAGTNR
ncbi:MAG TPA: biotin carboxylase N-terminal domain-containing protein [Jatrophihabitans sp.]|nr:biotin carboxylase N-terminal domain-containing protein [Jatrophihabitans sp.]